MTKADVLNKIDTDHAVKIADRIWWVGHYMEDDIFQCQAYLIENGNSSVLIDPGSLLTFNKTLEKINEVISFDKIKYFICHHQDPDITSSLPHIDKMLKRDDCLIISHWRTIALLKHYDLKTTFLCVEKSEWQLDIEDRIINFVFTPYLHFPGAFCTFDNKSGILFSSDIFGGFTHEWELFAKDEGYFESMRPFHEHYMPSHKILLNGLLEIEKYPVKMIAPQHGSIIKEHLVKYVIKNLKELDCGLFLLSKGANDIERLSQINITLRNILDSMVNFSSFKDIVFHLLKLSQRLLPVESLEFYISIENEKVLHMTPETRYRGDIISPPLYCKKIYTLKRGDLSKSYIQFDDKDHNNFIEMKSATNQFFVPLFTPKYDVALAVAVFHLSKKVLIDEDVDQMISKFSIPLAVTIEREAIYRVLELERNRIYEVSIHDQLTNLYTRHYMNESVERLINVHLRDSAAGIIVVIIDIDHFKLINDKHGHLTGDMVLKKVAELLLNMSRTSDIQVRYGGEEFMVFMTSPSIETGVHFAERFRKSVQKIDFEVDSGDIFNVSISAGVAYHLQEETLDSFLQRADDKLYEAKETGRNQVCVAC